jgi:GMP synthase-like glutamine amidotransferase
VRVLSIIHENSDSPALFGAVVRDEGHEHVEWRINHVGEPPGGPFDCAMVFGGTMNTHEEESFPWLRREHAELREFIAAGVPVLGVCLGGQLIAKALDAAVEPSPVPEIGWVEVAMRPEATGDPVVGGLPARFMSLQWHHYRFELPEGAVPLAANTICLQAYRHGDSVWGFQFHPEVTREILQEWIDESEALAPMGIDYRAFEEASDVHIGEWNRIGRQLVTSFLAVAAARAGSRQEARTG